MDLYYEAMSGLIADPRLFSTIHAGRVDLETNEVTEALYDEAGQYCEAVSRSLDLFHTEEYPTNDLMLYLHWPGDPQMESSIKSKVHSAHISVEAEGNILYAKLELDMSADLTIPELEAFVEQVGSQYRDGWGAQFELTNIPTGDGAVCLRLWHDEISFFTAAARERSQHEKHQGQLSRGPMNRPALKKKKQAER